MAFAFVRTTALASTSPAVVTLSGATTAGNLLVVFIRGNNATHTVTSVVDDVGNTYVASGAIVRINSVFSLQQWYGVQVIGGATELTVTLSAAGLGTRVIVDEFSGGEPTNAAIFDAHIASAQINSSPVSAPTFAPTNNGELIVAGLATQNNATPFSAGSGYTFANNSETVNVTEYLLSSTTSETPSASYAGSSTPGGIMATAFIPLGVSAASIAASESPILSESLSRYSDQVNAMELVSIVLSPPAPSITQNVTVGESLSISLSDAAVTKSESIAVSESTSVFHDTSLTWLLGTSDAATLTDSVNVFPYVPPPDLGVTITAGIQQTGGVRVV